MKSSTFISLIFSIVGIATISTAQNHQELDSLGQAYYDQKQLDKALITFEQALKIIQTKSPKNDSLLFVATNKLGLTYLGLKNYDVAEKYLLLSLEHGKKHGRGLYLKSLSDLGELYTTQNDFGLAEEYYTAALKETTTTSSKLSPIYLRLVLDLVPIYIYSTAYSRAELLLLETLELEGISKSPLYLSLQFELSKVYFKKEDYEAAEKTHLAALAILKKSLGNNSYDANYLNNYKNLGGIYAMLNKVKEAENVLVTCFDISKKIYTSNDPRFLTSIANLSGFYQKTGQFEKAKVLLYESLRLYSIVYPTEQHQWIQPLTNLHQFYLKQGQLDSATYYLQQALLVNLKTAPSTENILEEQLALQASDFDFQFRLKGLYSLYHLTNLTKAYFKKTNDNRFLKLNYLYNKAGLKLVQKWRSEFVSDEDKMHYSIDILELGKQSLETLFTLDQQNLYAEDILEIFELNKSILLEEATNTQTAQRFGDLPDSLILVEQQLQKKLSQAKVLIQEDKPNAQETYNNLLVEVNDFKTKIASSHPSYHDLKYNQAPTTLKDIQATLTDDVAILEYSFFDEQSYVLVITKNSLFFDTLSISRDELNETVANFFPFLSDFKLIVKDPENATKEYIRYAHQLYRSCLERPLSRLKNIKKLIIVSDNHLGYIPFEILLTKEVKSTDLSFDKMPYLLNDFDISYSYSAALWYKNFTKPLNTNLSKPNSILGMASRYNKKEEGQYTSTIYRTPRHKKLRHYLEELPLAVEEVKSLSQLFDGTFIYDSTGTESTFKKLAPDFGIIHLAMHGLMNKKEPLLSSLAFTSTYEEKGEDDFLEAWEISHLKLKANLVVLSACETGYGKFERSEGVMSLARSFMYAGVPSLIVSLWQVNDYSTAVIMSNFYQNLADGMTKDAALRQAKLNYLKTAKGITAHPAFWSPFIQLGDSRAIVLQSKGGFSWWILGLGVTLSGIIFLFFRKQKK